MPNEESLQTQLEDKLIGQKFGKLTVIEFIYRASNHVPIYKCLCDCGTYTNVRRSNFKFGITKSCGCISKEKSNELKSRETKVCKHCRIEKSVKDYQMAGGGKWLQPYCKPCDKERKRQYAIKNADRVKKKHKETYEKRKKLVPLEQKIINKKNGAIKAAETRRIKRTPVSEEEKKRRKREYGIKYRIKHRDSLKERKKKYAKSEEAKKRARERQSEQMSDIGFRVKKNLRGRVYVALKRGVKSESTMNLLGCTIDEFKAYFESLFTDGMSWKKYLEGGIHIDHKIPCIAFDLTKEEEQRKCFHYTNLQPLWAIDNLRKGVSLDFKKEENAR